jgi:hypothetical protein
MLPGTKRVQQQHTRRLQRSLQKGSQMREGPEVTFEKIVEEVRFAFS